MSAGNSQAPQKKVDPKVPTALDAERAVLGSILIENTNAMRVFSILDEKEFFLDSNQVIYRMMQSLAIDGSPIDILTLVDELKNTQLLHRAGGTGYISSLVDGIPKVSNVEHYAKMIRESSKKRKIIHLCEEVQQEAFSNGSVDEILEVAVQKILDISSGSGGQIVRKWYDVAQSSIVSIERERKEPKIGRISSGLTDLDYLTSGLRKKELIVITGPTGNGKTLLAQQYAINASGEGFRGIIFSAEMSGEQLVMRHIAFDSKVEFWKLRKPEYLTDEEMVRLNSSASQLRPITVIEQNISPASVWAISEAHKRSKGLDFVIVDYDQLVIETGIKADDEESFFRHQRNFVLEAKRIAERLDICFILLSQLRKVSHRVAQGGKPTIDDIYGDSSIRNTPHVIIWVVREFFAHEFKKEFENKATVYVIKARNDSTGKIKLFFDHVYVHLEDKHPDESDSTEESTRTSKPGKQKSSQTSFTMEE